MSLLVKVYYVVQGEYTCADARNFVEELGKLDLNIHEIYGYSIVEIELFRGESEFLLEDRHGSELFLRGLPGVSVNFWWQ